MLEKIVIVNISIFILLKEFESNLNCSVLCEMGDKGVSGIALHMFDYSYCKFQLCGTIVQTILTVVYKMDF